MGLVKIPQTRYYRDKSSEQKRAKELLGFLRNNKTYLKPRDNDIIASLLVQDTPYTDKQIGLIDTLYERMMKGAGYESYSRKHDFKKRLRY